MAAPQRLGCHRAIGKKRQSRARLTALTRGVVDAVLGAVAAHGVVRPFAGTFPVESAVAVALAGYFGRELLTEERATAVAVIRSVKDVNAPGAVAVPRHHAGAKRPCSTRAGHAPK